VFHAAKFDEVQNFVALPESVMSPNIPQDVASGTGFHMQWAKNVLVSIGRRLGKTGLVGLAGLQAFVATASRSAKDVYSPQVGFAQYTARSMDIDSCARKTHETLEQS